MQQLLAFLEQLEANNSTERMHAHQPAYKQAKQTLLTLAQRYIDAISTFDHTLGELFPQETIFRLARDSRFSKDKSPYKTNMGIVIAPWGKKSIFPCYYIHLQPGNRSFLAAGLYHPEPKIQQRVRNHLVTHRSSFNQILGSFPWERWPIEGGAYKKVPSWYDPTHPGIAYIKQKDRITHLPLTDKQVLSPWREEQTKKHFQFIFPLNQRLHSALLNWMKEE